MNAKILHSVVVHPYGRGSTRIARFLDSATLLDSIGFGPHNTGSFSLNPADNSSHIVEITSFPSVFVLRQVCGDDWELVRFDRGDNATVWSGELKNGKDGEKFTFRTRDPNPLENIGLEELLRDW